MKQVSRVDLLACDFFREIAQNSSCFGNQLKLKYFLKLVGLEKSELPQQNSLA